MARVLPIHEFVMARDKKHAAASVAAAAAAAGGDVDVNKMNKSRTMDMLKFNNNMIRVLKQLDPELSITCEASAVMNGILSNMMLRLIHKSFKNSLRRRNNNNNSSKLSANDINAAVMEVFPPQMAKLARTAARKALATRRVSKLSDIMDQTMSMN